MAKKDEKKEAVFGQASSDKSEHGRIVVVHEDHEMNGRLYKAGVHDLPVEEADALIADEKAFEPEGKGKGRDEPVNV